MGLYSTKIYVITQLFFKCPHIILGYKFGDSNKQHKILRQFDNDVMKSPDVETLSKRFANRLNELLNAKGFPSSSLDRARALGNELDLDHSLTSTLLNGRLMPDWGVMLQICELMEREPGYFLDAAVKQFPTDTEIVKPKGKGGPLVLRLPDQSSRQFEVGPDADLNYVVAHSGFGFGLANGDLLVNFTRGSGPMDARLNNLYVFQTGNEMEVLQCTLVTEAMAYFESAGQSSHRTLRMMPSGRLDPNHLVGSQLSYCGEITAVVRPEKYMPRL